MLNLEMLCKHIIDTNGVPSKQNVLEYGYSEKNFDELTNSNVKPERIVKNAREMLVARGIHYKEEM